MDSGHNHSGRAVRGPAHRAARRSPTAAAAGEPAIEPAAGRWLRHPRRREAGRESKLQALRAEVTGLRAQLAESLVREAQARALARTDPLTRLRNRAAFLEQLREALAGGDAKSTDFAVLFIDLDGFKAINDRHGHRVGDELLRIVGEQLSACVRSSDVVARLGGDEFACLVRCCGARDRIAQVAGKVLDTLRDPYQLGSLRVKVQASVGIATPQTGVSATALLDRADASMYRAKRLRSGFEFYSTDESPARFDDEALLAGAESFLS